MAERETDEVIVLDTETTGLDPWEDRIVSLAMIEVQVGEDGSLTERSRWSSLFNPERPIPAEASAVNGIYDEDVADAPTFDEHAALIQRRLDGRIIAGYNSRSFDTAFVDNALRRAGEAGLDFQNIGEIDPFLVWKRIEPRSLRSAHKRWTGEEFSEEQAHGAEADAEAALRVIRGMRDHPRGVGLQEMVNISSDPALLDRAGRLRLDDEGRVRFDFGKYEGTLAEDVPAGYLCWMTQADFPADTLEIVDKLRAEGFPRWEQVYGELRTLNGDPDEKD